jgi:hypothetical protein
VKQANTFRKEIERGVVFVLPALVVWFAQPQNSFFLLMEKRGWEVGFTALRPGLSFSSFIISLRISSGSSCSSGTLQSAINPITVCSSISHPQRTATPKAAFTFAWGPGDPGVLPSDPVTYLSPVPPGLKWAKEGEGVEGKEEAEDLYRELVNFRFLLKSMSAFPLSPAAPLCFQRDRSLAVGTLSWGVEGKDQTSPAAGFILMWKSLQASAEYFQQP